MSQKLPSMANAVTDSIRRGQIKDWGRGARVLAERYAALIDRAELVYQELEQLRREEDGDEQMCKRLERLQAAVKAQQVASDLGPKLLQALDRLGLTPMARVAPSKGGQEDGRNVPGGTSPEDKLAQLRARRAARSS